MMRALTDVRPYRRASAVSQSPVCSMIAWHLPDDGSSGGNPYWRLLAHSLQSRGVTVVSVPYRHLTGLRAFAGRPDILHFQFVAPYVLPAEPSRSRLKAVIKGVLFLLQVWMLRLVGCRIVWTVHNLVNHERRLARVEWFYTLLFTRLVHLLVVHGDAARREVIATYRLERRAARVAVIFHPNYIGAYPDDVSREEARERLGIDASSVVILCLGQLRRYKGLPEIVRAFRGMRGRERAALWIAGEPVDAALAAHLQQEVDASPGVHLRVGAMPPGEVELLLKASDVVALPYRSILTSGAAILAMSYGRPCVAPRLGSLVDVLDDKGAFLYDAAEPDGLREALALAVASSSSLPAMGRHNFAKASAWTWEEAARMLVDLYDGLLGERTPQAANSEDP